MLQVPLPPKMLCILYRIAVVTGVNVCDSWLSNSVLVGDVAKRNVVTYSVYESGDVYHRDVVTSVYITHTKKNSHLWHTSPTFSCVVPSSRLQHTWTAGLHTHPMAQKHG